MRIAFISADWALAAPGEVPSPGGAGWVRIHQPAAALANRGGHDVVVGAGVASDRQGRLIPLGHDGTPLMLDPELVVLQRWMHVDALDAIREARAQGQVVINDVDDWFWGLDRRNQAHRYTDARRNSDHNREHYKRIVLVGDAVTVSTRFLAKRIRERLGARTILIRNAVDLPTFATQPVSDATGGLTVGWVGALAWRSGDLETMRPVLPGFLDETQSRFVHHGVFPGDSDTAAGRIGLEPHQVGPSRQGCIPQDYPNNVAGFDIGIVPLTDVPFNHAKSWIKGLEYAAAGIPFVAQALPEYEDFPAGITARTPADWVAALHTLTDPATRREHQKRGLRTARDHDYRTRWTDWETAYTALLNRSEPHAQERAHV